MSRHSNQDPPALKVVFAPDWRDGVSYQGLLEEFCLIMLPWAVGFRSRDPINLALD